MSVVAWDGETLAADRALGRGETKTEGSKLFVSRNKKRACAVVGDVAEGFALAKWYISSRRGAAPVTSDSTLIIVEDGACYEIGSNGQPIRVEGKFAAWGSGDQVAIGALAHGASAIEAVKICCTHCDGCGFGVDSFTVQEE